MDWLRRFIAKIVPKQFKRMLNIENINKIENAAEIDVSPLNWFGCDEKYGSPYNMLRHYMLVLTKGYIPPKYLHLEKKSDG